MIINMNSKNLAPRIGICVKDKTQRIDYQNQACIHSCGDLQGTMCEKGCMEGRKSGESGDAFAEGVTLKKNMRFTDGLVDAVVIDDGEKITTLLHYKDDQINRALRALEDYCLSNAETAVVKLLISGYSNKQISRELHISIGTIKTHLNNIYRKIPPSLKTALSR